MIQFNVLTRVKGGEVMRNEYFRIRVGRPLGLRASIIFLQIQSELLRKTTPFKYEYLRIEQYYCDYKRRFPYYSTMGREALLQPFKDKLKEYRDKQPRGKISFDYQKKYLNNQPTAIIPLYSS